MAFAESGLPSTPGGLVVVESPDPPQPNSNAATRPRETRVLGSRIRRKTYPAAGSPSPTLMFSGCRCSISPHIGQLGSGTTGSRLTSIVRRS
jgi:hypothetical protein